MRILFLHGWQSTPGGLKPTYLKDHGHEVLNPALPDDDFDAAVRVAQAAFDRHRPDVVVGSSRGGAVAMNIDSGSTPLVLLCPAWKRWGTATTVKPATTILHSQVDDVVPFSDSVELLRNSRLSLEPLIEVEVEHRLDDAESLAKMLKAVEIVSAPHFETRARFRFGVGTLLLVTTMYAVLFAIMRTLGIPPILFVVVALLFTVVGLGQAFLFEGKQPRKASMITGASFGVGLEFVSQVVYQVLGYSRPPFDPFWTAFLGAGCGYVAGRLISGAFLVIDKAKCFVSRSKGTDKAIEAGT